MCRPDRARAGRLPGATWPPREVPRTALERPPEAPPRARGGPAAAPAGPLARPDPRKFGPGGELRASGGPDAHDCQPVRELVRAVEPGLSLPFQVLSLRARGVASGTNERRVHATLTAAERPRVSPGQESKRDSGVPTASSRRPRSLRVCPPIPRRACPAPPDGTAVSRRDGALRLAPATSPRHPSRIPTRRPSPPRCQDRGRRPPPA